MHRLWIPLGQIGLVAVLLLLWQIGASSRMIDASTYGTPAGVASYLTDALFITGDLWVDLGWTIQAVLLAFALGSLVAIVLASVFARWPLLERLAEPMLTALNAMPRIALAPMFIIWFGLGIGSKVAVGVSLTFFIMLSATIAGIRGVNSDHLVLARTLGATPMQIFRTITLPGAVPVVFSGLRLGLIYAMLGVVGSELIASRNGIGQKIAYMSSTFNVDAVMGIIMFLALIGYAISQGMTLLEGRLSRWK